MTLQTNFYPPIPRTHVLVEHNYRIPQFFDDAIKKTIDYVKQYHPGLIDPKANFGEQVALVIPLFNYHDERLQRGIPELSIDDFVDAANALVHTNCYSLLTVIRYCSKNQFDALERIPDFCSCLRNAEFTESDVEPFINHLESEKKRWIAESPVFAPNSLVNLHLFCACNPSEDSKCGVKKVPPITLVAGYTANLTYETLAPYMEADQIRFIAKHASFRMAIAIKNRLEESNSPHIGVFLDSLEHNSRFIHVTPKHTLENELSTFQRSMKLAIDEIEFIRKKAIKQPEDKEKIERAIKASESTYYREACDQFQRKIKPLIKQELFDRFNKLIALIKTPKPSSETRHCLLNMLKEDPEYFLHAFSEKPEFLETLKLLRETDPFFAKSLSNLCLLLLDRNPQLIGNIIDSCNPYEKKLLFIHLIKHASTEQKIDFAKNIDKDIKTFLNIWTTVQRDSLTTNVCVKILENSFDHLKTASFVKLFDNPVIVEILLIEPSAITIAVGMHLVNVIDAPSQCILIASRNGPWEKANLLERASEESFKTYIANCNPIEFVEIFTEFRVKNSAKLLAVLQHCTDEQFATITHPPQITDRIAREDMLAFLNTISESRREKIIKLYQLEPTSCFDVPIHVLLMPNLPESFFERDSLPGITSTQVKLLARYGNRQHQEDLFKYLSIHFSNELMESFYSSLPKEIGITGQLTLSDFITEFNCQLNMHSKKLFAAAEKFFQKNFDYKTVVKPIRKSFKAYTSALRQKARIIEKVASCDLSSYNKFEGMIYQLRTLRFINKEGRSIALTKTN